MDSFESENLRQNVVAFLVEQSGLQAESKIARLVAGRLKQVVSQRTVREELSLMADSSLIKKEVQKGLGGIKLTYYRITDKGMQYFYNTSHA